MELPPKYRPRWAIDASFSDVEFKLRNGVDCESIYIQQAILFKHSGIMIAKTMLICM